MALSTTEPDERETLSQVTCIFRTWRLITHL